MVHCGCLGIVGQDIGGNAAYVAETVVQGLYLAIEGGRPNVGVVGETGCEVLPVTLDGIRY